MEAAAPTVGVRVAQLAVPDVTAVERTIGAFAARPNRGLIVLANRTTIAHRQRIIALAAQYRLPAMYSYRYFVQIVAEVAHEALLRAWPRLREWLREERDFLESLTERFVEQLGQVPTRRFFHVGTNC